jgi:hypothetical protein
MKKLVAGLIVLLIVAVTYLGIAYSSQKKEVDRLANNQHALLGQVSFYQTQDSLKAASVEKLVLTKSELEYGNKELAKTIESLNIKLRKVQSASQSGTTTTYTITTTVRDTVFRDRTDTVKCIKYVDKWLTLDGCIDRSTFSGKIESRDTIVQVVHRVPKKFWFIKYGTKAIRQEVVSKNPHTKVTFTEYIELK